MLHSERATNREADHSEAKGSPAMRKIRLHAIRSMFFGKYPMMDASPSRSRSSRRNRSLCRYHRRLEGSDRQ